MVVKDLYDRDLVFEDYMQHLHNNQNPVKRVLLDSFYTGKITEGQREALQTYLRLQLWSIKTVLQDLDEA